MTSQVRRIAGCHLLLRGNRWMPISVNKTLGAKDRCSPGGAVISAYLSAVVEDAKLLEKFNIYGSQRKGWLPPSYGKKRYREMTPEEQAVVDEFQGEERYTEVMEQPDYFIVADTKLFLGGGTELND
jgi:hypothetical protein